jgi:required for meiotic nuclear division protein 1
MFCAKQFFYYSGRSRILNRIKQLPSIRSHNDSLAFSFTKRLSAKTSQNVLSEDTDKVKKINEKELAQKNSGDSTQKPTQSTTAQAGTTSKNMTSITTSSVVVKNRFKKKKHNKFSLITSSMPSFKVKAYATADFYDLETLKAALIKSGAYDIHEKDIPEHCICAKAKYLGINEIEPRHIFFFDSGTVVFWNVSIEEQNNLLTLLEKHSQKLYPKEIIKEESEIMSFSRIILNNKEMLNITHHPNTNGADNVKSPSASTSHTGSSSYVDNQISLNYTRLANNHIYFSNSDSFKNTTDQSYVLEKYSFSDAIALSVKLGIWEKDLDRFSENIEYISEDLKRGRQLALDVEQVLQMLGELFAMKHNVNLHYSLLDTPDFYWYFNKKIN